MDERERADRASYWRAKLAAETELLAVLRHVEKGEGDFVLVDTRPRAAYERERIPGAISLPVDDVDGLLPGLDPGRPYVLYCWRST
jgi:rhodanese-related sulfurtransferase